MPKGIPRNPVKQFSPLAKMAASIITEKVIPTFPIDCPMCQGGFRDPFSKSTGKYGLWYKIAEVIEDALTREVKAVSCEESSRHGIPTA
jgi:hypothetical protein